MLRHYLETKAEPPDAILMYRMGDFYEMFVEDAETAAPVLEIALTAEHSMMGQPLPESGILDVRLDADGSASTSGPEDLSSRTAAKLGETVSVVLSP